MFYKVVEHGATLAPLRIASFGHGDEGCENTFWFVAEFLLQELNQAITSQRGAGEKYERESDFADYENVAETNSGGACGGIAAGVAEECGLILARELKSRSQTEKNTGEDGDGDGEDEDIEIERDYGFVRDRVFGEKGHDGFDSTVGEEHAESAARDREDHAFGEELLDDAPGAGAHSGADGDLTATGAGPSEKEIGDIGARDQEKEADRGQQGHQSIR